MTKSNQSPPSTEPEAPVAPCREGCERCAKALRTLGAVSYNNWRSWQKGVHSCGGPSAEPEAVRIARNIGGVLCERIDIIERAAFTMANHILRDHEQRERAREGMDEAVRDAARIVAEFPDSAENAERFARALLAAHERIATLEAEVRVLAAEVEALRGALGEACEALEGYCTDELTIRLRRLATKGTS